LITNFNITCLIAKEKLTLLQEFRLHLLSHKHQNLRTKSRSKRKKVAVTRTVIAVTAKK